MNTINFYDKQRNLLMQFRKFDFSEDSVISIVRFECEINFEECHIKTNLKAEIFDFKNLVSSLYQMYEDKQKYVTFNPLLSKIVIQFHTDKDYGHIHVESEIINNMSTYHFKFEYGIDQSFLPELISEIEGVLENGIPK